MVPNGRTVTSTEKKKKWISCCHSLVFYQEVLISISHHPLCYWTQHWCKSSFTSSSWSSTHRSSSSFF